MYTCLTIPPLSNKKEHTPFHFFVTVDLVTPFFSVLTTTTLLVFSETTFALFVFIILVVDILYGIIDPRIRIQGGKG